MSVGCPYISICRHSSSYHTSKFYQYFAIYRNWSFQFKGVTLFFIDHFKKKNTIVWACNVTQNYHYSIIICNIKNKHILVKTSLKGWTFLKKRKACAPQTKCLEIDALKNRKKNFNRYCVSFARILVVMYEFVLP